MNAVNPVPSPAMPSAGAAEPSMEEILASIRRIIADDSAATRQRASAEQEIADPPPTLAPTSAADPHELLAFSTPDSDALRSPSQETPIVEPAHLPRHPLAPPAEAAHLGSPPPDHAAETPAETERLLSAATDSSVMAAFNTLAASRFVDNSEQLLGLVREMIRPLVKNWVDEHLPGMVERIVAAEIERMARGSR